MAGLWVGLGDLAGRLLQGDLVLQRQPLQRLLLLGSGFVPLPLRPRLAAGPPAGRRSPSRRAFSGALPAKYTDNTLPPRKPTAESLGRFQNVLPTACRLTTWPEELR